VPGMPQLLFGWGPSQVASAGRGLPGSWPKSDIGVMPGTLPGKSCRTTAQGVALQYEVGVPVDFYFCLRACATPRGRPRVFAPSALEPASPLLRGVRRRQGAA